MRLAILAALLAAAAGSYRDEISAWRAAREARLKADAGWLTVVGLFWLKPGINRAGSAENDDIVLPAGSAPARAGVVDLTGNRVLYRAPDGAVTELRPDTSDHPNSAQVGRVKLFLLLRGGRYAIRVKDNASPLRKNFVGLRWFPVDPAWRIRGRFIPFAAPKKLTFQTAVGVPDQMDSPGVVEFTRAGRTYTLQPALDGPNFFFVFRDATSGKTTYGGGRFLDTPPARGGVVVLDFNRAYNPPCVFTPYATCPLPPKQNRLDLAVTAGEQSYAGHP